MMHKFSMTLVAVAAVGACSSYPMPAQRLASAEGATRSAEEVGAAQDPRAAMHLKLAKNQLDQAKALINDGDYKRADFVLLRAKHDAELALTLARGRAIQAEADRAVQQAEELRRRGGAPTP
jgi:hypothetical protein